MKPGRCEIDGGVDKKDLTIRTQSALVPVATITSKALAVGRDVHSENQGRMCKGQVEGGGGSNSPIGNSRAMKVWDKWNG